MVPTDRYAYEWLMIEVVLSLVAYGFCLRRGMIGKAWCKVASVGSIAPIPHKGCVQRHPSSPTALSEWSAMNIAYTWFMLVLV